MTDLRERMSWFYQDRFVSPLKRPAHQFAIAIEALHPRSLQPLHTKAQIRLIDLDRQVKVVPHHDVRMNPPSKLYCGLSQRSLERLSRSALRKQIAPVIPAIDHVITRPRILHPQRSRHRKTTPPKPAAVNVSASPFFQTSAFKKPSTLLHAAT
jgi:hypothetical protein